DFRVFKFRQRRKFVLGQPQNFEETLAAPDGSGIFSIHIDLNFARREFADDVEKAARGESGRSCFVHVRFATAAHTDVKISSREMDFILASLKQNVGKNRKSGTSADHVLDLLQTFEQFFFRNAKFHDDREAL